MFMWTVPSCMCARGKHVPLDTAKIEAYGCFHDRGVIDEMQIIFKAITGSSGHAFWLGKN